MTVVGYLRVSTVGQSEDGLSLKDQGKRIRGYCDLHGLTLAELIADEGISAKNLSDRPGATKMMAMIRDRKIDGIVTCKLDRLVRNTRDAIDIATLCKQKGVALHSIGEKIDTDSAIGGFFFTLMAALAELERKQVGERTAAVLRHKKSLGEKTGGDVPYGYRIVIRQRQGKKVKTLAKFDDEQAVVGLVQQLRAKGESLRRIAATLRAKGIKNRNGDANWHPWSIRSIADFVA